MSPEEIALLAVLFVFGVAGVGYAVERLDRKARARRRRKRGVENRRRAAEEAELVCVECGVRVDPEKGAIYDHDAWWCEEDWKKTFQP